jgi:hypothetical protein
MSAAFPATIPVRLDAEGRIDTDVDCPGCGYNLRMQRPREGCPECGTAIDVEDRAAADELRLADAGWLRRIRRGAKWLHAAVWLSLLGVLPGLLLAAAGLWLLTTREPNRDETWFARGTRLSARWAPVLSAAAGLGALVLLIRRRDEMVGSVTGMLAQDWQAFDVLASAAAAAMAVGMLEAWRYLFKLAARADGPAVAQRCRRAWKQYLAAVAVIVGIAVATNLSEPTGIRLPSPYFEWTAVILTCVVTAVLLWVWWVTRAVTGELVRVLSQ